MSEQLNESYVNPVVMAQMHLARAVEHYAAAQYESVLAECDQALERDTFPVLSGGVILLGVSLALVLMMLIG